MEECIFSHDTNLPPGNLPKGGGVQVLGVRRLDATCQRQVSRPRGLPGAAMSQSVRRPRHEHSARTPRYHLDAFGCLSENGETVEAHLPGELLPWQLFRFGLSPELLRVGLAL